jgi:OmpA-OmpF porin, OOP family
MLRALTIGALGPSQTGGTLMPFRRSVLGSAAAGCALLLAILWLPASALAAGPTGDPELRRSLFGGADRALAAANENQARLLAPQSYGEAAESYRRAESTFNSGGGIESIQRNLSRAQALFEQSAQAAAVARQEFRAALTARNNAASAQAERFEPEAWRRAEQTLTEAALRLERGRNKVAEREAGKAEALFQQAELAAIKSNYLQETRSLLETAEKLRAQRHAPLSYQRARELLAEAERELNENRYDTDRPRNLAKLAEHTAHHAIYVATLERRVRDGDTTLEQILLDWQSGIAAIADPLDEPVYFDAGYEDAVQRIVRGIVAQQSDLTLLRQRVSDREAQIESLERELGGQAESLQRVNAALQRREQQRARIDRVELLFPPDQAIVMRQGDSVILRLIGLNFASGSAALTAAHNGILATVKDAIATFPESSIVIEGHTDSFGSEAANQTLSQDRAEAVRQYLLANSALPPTDVRALGYGESRPVANNETPEGRARNRRIDIVIYPKW